VASGPDDALVGGAGEQLDRPPAGRQLGQPRPIGALEPIRIDRAPQQELVDEDVVDGEAGDAHLDPSRR